MAWPILCPLCRFCSDLYHTSHADRCAHHQVGHHTENINHTYCHSMVLPNIKLRHGIWKFNEETVTGAYFGFTSRYMSPVADSQGPLGPTFFLKDFRTYLPQENDRQYRCNVTLRSSRVTIVALRYYECLSVPARKAHLFCPVLYYRLLPVWFYHIFPHRLINTKIFRKRIIEYKAYGSICCTIFFRNISHSKKNSARYYHLLSHSLIITFSHIL